MKLPFALAKIAPIMGVAVLALGIALSAPATGKISSSDLGPPTGPAIVTSGAIQTERGYQSPLPSNGDDFTIGSLGGENGTGLIRANRPSRLLAQGQVTMVYNGPPGGGFGKCWLALVSRQHSDPQLGPNSFIAFGGNHTKTMAIAGSATVPAGLHDVAVLCRSAGDTGWVDVAVNVLVVPN